MPSSLIRSRYVVARAVGRDRAEVLEDAAIFQQDGVIREIGPYEALRQRHRADQILGSPDHVVLPGFVNAHHHVGLTPFQLGSPDLPLELWFASRLGMPGRRSVSRHALLRLRDARVGRHHRPAHVPAGRARPRHGCRKSPTASSRRTGTSACGPHTRTCSGPEPPRVRGGPGVRAAPAAGSRPGVAAFLAGQAIPVTDQLDLFRSLWEAHGRNGGDRIRIQLAPANLHWCSDEALTSRRERRPARGGDAAPRRDGLSARVRSPAHRRHRDRAPRAPRAPRAAS